MNCGSRPSRLHVHEILKILNIREIDRIEVNAFKQTAVFVRQLSIDGKG